jgi:hypothetical protein
MAIYSSQPSSAIHSTFDRYAVQTNPYKPVKHGKAEKAAYDLSEFYCYMLAKVFTEALETENFEQEITYSTQLPHALGTVYAESIVGQNLKNDITRTLNGQPLKKDLYSGPFMEREPNALEAA